MMDSVCRTCLSSTDLWPLFPVPGQQRSFARALYLSTGLQIKVNDGLPQKICQICANTVEDAMRFRLQSEAAERRLQLFKDKLDVRKKTFRMENVMLLEQDELQRGCEKIENAFSIQSFMENKNGGKNVASSNQFNKNTKKELTLTPSITIKSEIEKELDKLCSNGNGKYCTHCDKNYKSTKYLKKHILWKHLDPKILCEFCGVVYKDIHVLLGHQRTKHGVARDKAYLCSMCDFNGLYQKHLEEHIRGAHTKERPFACKECDARFFTRAVLRQHMTVHKSDRPFVCHICSKRCRRRNELTGHINTTHLKKYKKNKCKIKKYRYGCYLCSKIFETRFGARQHIEKTHGIPFKDQTKLLRYDRAVKKDECNF